MRVTGIYSCICYLYYILLFILIYYLLKKSHRKETISGNHRHRNITIFFKPEGSYANQTALYDWGYKKLNHYIQHKTRKAYGIHL